MSQVYAQGSDGPPSTRFTSGYNSSASTIAAKATVVRDLADADGLGFNLPATAMGGVVAGILQESVGSGLDTDKIVSKGIVDAFVEGTTDITLGDSLKPVDGQRYLVKDAAGALSSAVQGFTALEAFATDSEGTISVSVNLPG